MAVVSRTDVISAEVMRQRPSRGDSLGKIVDWEKRREESGCSQQGFGMQKEEIWGRGGRSVPFFKMQEENVCRVSLLVR